MKLCTYIAKNIRYIVNSLFFPEKKIQHFIFASEFSLCDNLLRTKRKVEIYLMR